MYHRYRIFIIIAALVVLVPLSLGAFSNDCAPGACDCGACFRVFHNHHSTEAPAREFACADQISCCSLQAPGPSHTPEPAQSAPAFQPTGKSVHAMALIPAEACASAAPRFSFSSKEKAKPGPFLAVYLQNSSLLC